MTPPAPRPFTLDVPQARIDALYARLAATDIGYAPADDADWRYGVDARYLADFRDYWISRYDWRTAERSLNAFPQFIADIDGLPIHFYHVRGSGEGRFPVILTHGWPGSVVEFLGVIDRIVHPERFGGQAADGLDVVIPSLPGYGFSGRPRSPIGPRRIAAIWRQLMVDILGYDRFGAQGGDWGSVVSVALAADHGDVVSAIHLNMVPRVEITRRDAAFTAWRDEVNKARRLETAYRDLQQTKPQTIGLALSDSPLGFAGWVLEKCRSWADNGGDIEAALPRDQLITNIMTYLLNDAVTSAIWLYNAAMTEAPPRGYIETPTGVARFPVDVVPPAPRPVVEQGFNVVHWTDFDKGGHFAAWEQPAAFAGDLVNFFRAYR